MGNIHVVKCVISTVCLSHRSTIFVLLTNTDTESHLQTVQMEYNMCMGSA